MPCTFEIKNITVLPKAKVAVLDGTLLAGAVTTDSTAELVHCGQCFPLRVKGVASIQPSSQCDALSVTVSLMQDAMTIAAIGDRIVCE